METELLTQLDDSEKEWWGGVIKDFRSRLITEPKLYANNILTESWTNEEEMLNNLDSVIKSARDQIWQLYLIDEAKFHAEVLAYLFMERDLPKSILESLVSRDVLCAIENQEDFTKELGRLMGLYAGRVMPYVYELALSTTQSRRSRAGKTFEHLVESLLEHFGVSYNNQSSVASTLFSSAGLGKKVDAIVPGIAQYISNRSKCAVVTMKTTLRERWQEVAEELSRTNVPHIYLLTADENVTINVIDTMKNYNIALVVYGSEKNTKFQENENVYSFTDFFTREMRFIMAYWEGR